MQGWLWRAACLHLVVWLGRLATCAGQSSELVVAVCKVAAVAEAARHGRLSSLLWQGRPWLARMNSLQGCPSRGAPAQQNDGRLPAAACFPSAQQWV